MNFSFIDTAVFVSYAVFIIGIGLYVSRGKKGHERNAEDYFLASKSLPWWAIGASLIAANISAEQFIGMSGSGFAIGLAIASYEWMAAITLLIVGKFFLPIFIEKNIYTIPEFIEKRFSTNLKTILAVFWILLFVFVNLTTVLYLGATALDTIIGVGDGSILVVSIIGLALFAAAYSIWGGLSAVAWTDVVQVILLVLGGLITAYIALDNVTSEGGVLNGLAYIYDKVPEKFSMIIQRGEIITPNGKDAWWDLPGIAVIVGGLWVANLYYWGFNQYIIQRTLAAKSLPEAQKGIAFAAGLKLIIPLIVVIPGITAFVMNSNELNEVTQLAADSTFFSDTGNVINDNAFPWLIKNYIPVGLKGLVLAALAAAIVSSLASMLNSTATIFTMDIFKPYINRNAKDRTIVNVGRLTAGVSLLIAVPLAIQLDNVGQIFQLIQEYTGLVSPGILAVFLMGLFWKGSTNSGAIWGVVLSIPIAIYFKMHELVNNALFVEIPFMHQMLITCLMTMVLIAIISRIETGGANDDKGIQLNKSLFYTKPSFNISAVAIMVIVTMLYVIFW